MTLRNLQGVSVDELAQEYAQAAVACWTLSQRSVLLLKGGTGTAQGLIVGGAEAVGGRRS
jgi:hypothetical protein